MVVHGKGENTRGDQHRSSETARLLLWHSPGRMPYVFVRENYFKWWVKVEGLNHAELRHLTEKIGEQPEKQNELEKTAEFSIPTWMVLNGLEHLGYKVVTSDQYVTGQGSFDQKEFVWTLHKSREEWETSS